PAQGQLHPGDDLGRGEVQVRLGGEGAGHGLVGVEHHFRALGTDLGQRPVVVDHDHVAAQHQVGLAGGDAYGMDVGRRARQADVGGDRAALLRQAGLVEHGGALAFQVPGHAQQGADGHHAGAADAGDQDVPGTLEISAPRWRRQVGEQVRTFGARALARAAAVHGDEAGAEALDAAVVLVAVGLVDLALAPELGLLRQHRHAEALLPAVAATLAHQGVDHHPLLRVLELAALAAATLLGGTGLVVDQDGHALDLAQALLDRVEFGAVVELHARREQFALVPARDVVADQD